MNSFDLVILIVVAIFAVKGLIRGLIIEVFTLAGLLAGYIVALKEMSRLSDVLQSLIKMPPLVSATLSYLAIFLVIILLTRQVAKLLKNAFKGTLVGWVDRGGGTALGIAKGLLIASLACLLVSLIPLPDQFKSEKEDSALFEPVQSVAPAVFNFVIRVFPEAKDFYEEVKEGVMKKSKEAGDRVLSKKLESIKENLDGYMDSDSLQNELKKRVDQIQ